MDYLKTKYLFIYMNVQILFFLACLPIICGNLPIYLNESNVIVVKNAIDETTASKFIYQLNSMKNKKDVFVYLDTPGGSVESGNKILMEVQKYNLSCIADKAYSMGFVILQGCQNRYIRQYGRIMQHQISYGIRNEKGKIDSYGNFIDQVEEELVELQAEKIGMEKTHFQLKTMNDWWLMGKYAVKNNCADQIVDVFCDQKLAKSNYTDSFGNIHLVYSKCPLISDPLDVYIK